MTGTTFAKATLEYDAEHERALLEAITSNTQPDEGLAVVIVEGLPKGRSSGRLSRAACRRG